MCHAGQSDEAADYDKFEWTGLARPPEQTTLALAIGRRVLNEKRNPWPCQTTGSFGPRGVPHKVYTQGQATIIHLSRPKTEDRPRCGHSLGYSLYMESHWGMGPLTLHTPGKILT